MRVRIVVPRSLGLVGRARCPGDRLGGMHRRLEGHSDLCGDHDHFRWDPSHDGGWRRYQ